MHPRILILAIALHFVSTTTHAADMAGNYAIWGAGGTSCHQFQKSENRTSERYRAFLMGYLTAFNTLSDETYSATGTKTLDEALAMIVKYCKSHQMESFDRAIQQTLSELYNSRLRQPKGYERAWGRSAKTSPEQDSPE